MQRLNRPGFIALRSGWLWAGSWRNIFRPSNISLVTWALYLPQFRFPRSGQTHGPLPRARTRRSAAQGTHPDTGGWRQRHLRESDPEDPEVFLSKDVEAKQPHIRSFVKRAVTFGVCPGREGARPTAAARESRIDGISIADACAMQVSDLAVWLRNIEEPSVTPLLAFLREPSTPSRASGSVTCHWTAPPRPCRAVRRNAPGRSGTWARRQRTSPTSSTSPPPDCIPRRAAHG